jgi:hypothetical protein
MIKELLCPLEAGEEARPGGVLLLGGTVPTGRAGVLWIAFLFSVLKGSAARGI